jgi:trehalose 6-phosphate synthase
VRERAPRARIQHFTHIPWPMPDYWRILPDDIRRAIHESLLTCDIVGLHTDRYVRAFLHCCNELTDGEVDFDSRSVRFQGRDVQVRAYPISVDPAEFERLAASDEVREEEASVVLARPEKMILRVDRTDPSKNVVRGLRAYDLFLSQHPEWRGRVTMLALLDPSRPEIPEYAEYVGAIQRAVREVNDRWYMTGMWTPVDMRISDNFPQAVAAYKHYDVLLVNAIFDGMNLVAKEAPLVNQRDGVLILSENAGAHQELSPWALCVNPFDIQAQADAIYQALTMHATERHERIEGLRAQVREHDISRWIGTQLEDLAALRPVKA